jgi:CPA2 family monovalent cation:H+ antiporter-2
VADSFVADLTVVLGVAAVTSVVFRLVRQPTVLGYLLAGLVVGPYIPIPLFADIERMDALSEFGVILVMFSVGLEFSITRLMRLLPTSGLAAIVQVGAMAWLGFAFASVLGLGTTEGLFLGASLAISSTMLVVKVHDAQPADAPLRELVFGVLIVQDLVAVVLIAVLTAIASGSGVSTGHFVDVAVELGATLAVLVIGGLLVVPRLVRLLYRVGNPEMIVVSMAGLAFGLALLAHEIGYSVALGAFLAGMLVAESGRGRNVERVVRPVKDLFAAVFFVTVGMGVDPVVAVEHAGVSLALAAVIVVGQLLTVSFGGLLGGNGLLRSIRAGASLGQIGEFSFIIIGLGVATGVVPAHLEPIVVTTAVLTAFTTPLVFRYSDPLGRAVIDRLPRTLLAFISLYESWLAKLRTTGIEQATRSRVRRAVAAVVLDALALSAIVVGAALHSEALLGLASDSLGLAEGPARLLVAAGGVLLCLPFILGVVRNGRRIATFMAERMLPSAETGKADLAAAPRRVIVVTVQLGIVVAAGVPVAAFTQPLLPLGLGVAPLLVVMLVLVLYFWRSAAALGGHVRAVTPAIFELLQQRESGTPTPTVGEVLPGLEAVRTLTLPPQARAVGRTLGELSVHARTGATVLAVQHGESVEFAPRNDVVLDAGDVVALVGTAEAVDRARALLAAPAPPSGPRAPEAET